MTTKTVVTTTSGINERFVIEADWAQAKDTILLNGEPTKYQVASFQHSKGKAIKQIMRDYIRESGGGCPNCGDEDEEEDGGFMCGGDDNGNGCERNQFWKIEDNKE